MLGFPTHEVNARIMLLGDNIQAIRVVNSSSIHVLDPVNITTIIENPTTWTLKNISFSVTTVSYTHLTLPTNREV